MEELRKKGGERAFFRNRMKFDCRRFEIQFLVYPGSYCRIVGTMTREYHRSLLQLVEFTIPLVAHERYFYLLHMEEK